MSRSGYYDECDNEWALIRWRGAVASAIRGKIGQAFLKEMLAALDALPEKKLIKNNLRESSGAVCAIGAVGAARGLDMEAIDPDEPDIVARAFGISKAMAREIVYENDENGWHDTPEQRFERMRRWVKGRIVTAD